jgi:hypothetical protein
MLIKYACAQCPDPRFRNASNEEFNNAIADDSEIVKWLGKKIKYREFIHLKAVFISNMLRKLAICLATIFVLVLHSNAYGRLGFYMYNHGYTMMYGDSESKYFGLFYEKAPIDSLTMSNREFRVNPIFS